MVLHIGLVNKSVALHTQFRILASLPKPIADNNMTIVESISVVCKVGSRNRHHREKARFRASSSLQQCSKIEHLIVELLADVVVLVHHQRLILFVETHTHQSAVV